MALLRELANERGRAVLVVSHDARLEEIADAILWLEDGRVTSVGESPSRQGVRPTHRTAAA